MVHGSVYSKNAKYEPGLFLNRYGRQKGKDWVRRIAPEDRKVFSDLGRSRAPDNLPSIGGQARAITARRLPNGRFAKKEG